MPWVGPSESPAAHWRVFCNPHPWLFFSPPCGEWPGISSSTAEAASAGIGDGKLLAGFCRQRVFGKLSGDLLEKRAAFFRLVEPTGIIAKRLQEKPFRGGGIHLGQK